MLKSVSVRLALAAVAVITMAFPAFASDNGGWGASSAGGGWARAIAAGDSHLSQMHFARALDEYDRAQRIAPYSHVPYLRSATAYYGWGDAIEGRRGDLWPLALKHAEKARRLDPLSAEASFLSAVIRFRMGDYSGAVDIYRELEKVRQGDIHLYLDLALAAFKAGNRDLAATALQRAEAINPDSERLHSVAKMLLGGR